MILESNNFRLNQILVVEDDKSLLNLIEKRLKRNGYQVTGLTSGNECIDYIKNNNNFLLLLDQQLPDLTGQEIINFIKDNVLDIPFIVMTGQGDERLAVKVMKLGAKDYILKDIDFLDILPEVVERIIKNVENERKLLKTEKELKKIQELQSKLVANIGDVIVIIDENSTNRYKSPNLKNLFGWEPEELIGKHALDIVHPDDISRSVEFITDLFKEPGKVGKIEIRYQCKNGIYKWIEFIGCNLMNDPDINGVLGNYHDITDRKIAELELLKAKEKAEESDKLKTAFLQNISHEIRTPLNGIMGFVNLLEDINTTKQDLIEFKEIIRTSTDRLLEIVNNVLDLSKLQTGQISLIKNSVCINKLILDLYHKYKDTANAKKIELLCSINTESDDIIIETDEGKFIQIMTNLLSNALKFTHRGQVRFGYEFYDNQIRFFITDTGIGIPKELHERIFDRFTQAEDSITRNFEGAGLGLAICKGLVGLLGGRIWLNSVFGAGTTFYFTINEDIRNNLDLKPAAELKKSKNTLSKSKHILIVEDDITSYILLDRFFSSKNAVTYHAMNGLEAVNYISYNDVDLILMDIRMPVMDGITATIKIKEKKPNIPIIAQTAYGFSEERQKILEAGCDEHITKPIDLDKLNRIVNKYILF